MIRFNSIIKISVVMIILVNLTGCAFFAKKHSMALACDNAPVLYTNLKKPVYARQYTLPDGKACPVGSEGIANV